MFAYGLGKILSRRQKEKEVFCFVVLFWYVCMFCFKCIELILYLGMLEGYAAKRNTKAVLNILYSDN